MMISKRGLWVWAGGLALLLAACGGTPAPAGCSPDELIAPENISPATDEIVLVLEPVFEWDYSDACEPTGWHVQVTTYGGYEYGVTLSGDPLAEQTSWAFSEWLEPATQYEWHVAAKSGATLGPYSMSTDFWTGPICVTAELAAPQQFTPTDQSVVVNEFPPLGWSYPNDCIPTQTLLQLDTNPTFPGPNLVAGSGGPRIGQIPVSALADCTNYYWRVRSENADGEGPWSPIWTFRTDFTGACAPAPVCDTASLLPPVSNLPAAGDVVPDLMPSFSWFYPDACTPEGYRIDVTTYGGYEYGTTFSGGTGNPATTWGLADSLEPATQYEWRVAGINGTTLGPYSASVPFWTGPLCDLATLLAPVQNTPPDASTVNTEFPPLGWSYPGGCLPEFTLLELDADPGFLGPNLVAGFGGPRIGQIPLEALADCTTYYWHVRSETSGGAGPWSPDWTFETDFSGTCGGATPTPVVESPGEGKVQALDGLNCRAGDSTVFEVIGLFLEGDTAEVLGRNQLGTWLLVPKADLGGNCWVMTDLVLLDPSVDLNTLRVFFSPATPTPPPSPTVVPDVDPDFVVLLVEASVDEGKFAGKCPHRFTFSANITVEGEGDVSYRWVRSDGSAGPAQTLHFDGPGSQWVETVWELGSSGQIYENYWARVEILSPGSLFSNKAVFTLTCR